MGTPPPVPPPSPSPTPTPTPNASATVSGALSLVQLALAVLYSVLGQYTAAGAAASVIENIQAAIAALLAAHGSEVTQGGLESLRVTIPLPDWSNIPAPGPDAT